MTVHNSKTKKEKLEELFPDLKDEVDGPRLNFTKNKSNAMDKLKTKFQKTNSSPFDDKPPEVGERDIMKGLAKNNNKNDLVMITKKKKKKKKF